ncbi:MAG: hypothetical protein AB7U61_02445 [Methylocystis sp.]
MNFEGRYFVEGIITLTRLAKARQLLKELGVDVQIFSIFSNWGRVRQGASCFCYGFASTWASTAGAVSSDCRSSGFASALIQEKMTLERQARISECNFDPPLERR